MQFNNSSEIQVRIIDSLEYKMQLPNTEEINLMGNEKDWVAAKY